MFWINGHLFFIGWMAALLLFVVIPIIKDATTWWQSRKLARKLRQNYPVDEKTE